MLRMLVANSYLESGRTPVHELYCRLRLESGDGPVRILGRHISAVEQTGRHVFPLARITFHHLVVGLEAGECDFLH